VSECVCVCVCVCVRVCVCVFDSPQAYIHMSAAETGLLDKESWGLGGDMLVSFPHRHQGNTSSCGRLVFEPHRTVRRFRQAFAD
jgi:hypothetical protein